VVIFLMLLLQLLLLLLRLVVVWVLLPQDEDRSAGALLLNTHILLPWRRLCALRKLRGAGEALGAVDFGHTRQKQSRPAFQRHCPYVNVDPLRTARARVETALHVPPAAHGGQRAAHLLVGTWWAVGSVAQAELCGGERHRAAEGGHRGTGALDRDRDVAPQARVSTALQLLRRVHTAAGFVADHLPAGGGCHRGRAGHRQEPGCAARHTG